MILRGRGVQGPAPRSGGGQPGVRVSGDELVIDLDARALVDGIRREVLAEVRQQIRDGERPDGGPQRPLSKARAAEPREGSRGVKTGHMIDNLEASPIRGSAASASSTITVPGDRIVFLRGENKRGVQYLGIGPRHVAAAERIAGEMVEAMLDGKRVEAEQGRPLAKEEAGG